jgi:membrane peptidoglycan carboxypeptidase
MVKQAFIYFGVSLVLVLSLTCGFFLLEIKDEPANVADSVKKNIADVALPSTIYDRNGKKIADISEEARFPVAIKSIPLHTQRAFLAAEDSDFYEHHGVSVRGILRSLLVNLKLRKFAQGGSTITQQLVRQHLLTREKSFTRKLKEIYLAVKLESQLSKKEILELWLNGVYLGNNSWGVEAASRHYFRKGVKDLDVGESAVLAGLPQAPSRYAPHNNPLLARQRKHYVLNQMAASGWLSPASVKYWKAKKIAVFRDRAPVESNSPWVADVVRGELWQGFELKNIPKSGLRIQTGVDQEWQRKAEDLFAKKLSRFRSSGFEAAMVAVDVPSGQVRTILGSIDFRFSQYNRAKRLRRPLGSTVYPLIVAHAANQGLSTLPGGQSVGSSAVLSKFTEIDAVASAIGLGSVKDSLSDLGLRLGRSTTLDQINGNPLELALAWRVLEGHPLSRSQLFIRNLSRPDGSVIDVPSGRSINPGIRDDAAYAVKSWLALAFQGNGPRDTIRFNTSTGWNYWEISLNRGTVAVLWAGAERRMTSNVGTFDELKSSAYIVMDQWVEQTQSPSALSNSLPPKTMNWQIIKDSNGGTVHIPSPSAAL